MTDHIVVCPFNEKLLARIKQRAIVVNTNDFNIVHYIHKVLGESNRLHAIKIQTEKSLNDIPFQEEWMNIPLAIYSTQFGEFNYFLYHLNTVRKLNVRIFLSSQHEENFTGLKILSSLDIDCGLYFHNESYNWDLINDLMHYAVYSNTRHARIEPFDWMASNYKPTEYLDFNSVYFNDPTRYLHINEREQIALTAEDLQDGNYIDEGIESLEHIHENKKFIDSGNVRYDIMLSMNECAFCKAFRICLAKFSDLPDRHETCKTFFADFLDAADFSFSKRNKGTRIWQL